MVNYSACPAEDQGSAGRQIDGGAIAHGAVRKRHGSGKVGLVGYDASMPSESLRIAVEY